MLMAMLRLEKMMSTRTRRRRRMVVVVAAVVVAVLAWLLPIGRLAIPSKGS